MTRSEILSGPTYKVSLEGIEHLQGGRDMFITVNEQDGRPVEVFIRCDMPEVFEHVTAQSVQITRLLRCGEQLNVIAKELMEIHSPRTGHMVPGGRGWCPSLMARIGMVLLNHVSQGESCQK
jgi:hypothetical protein